MCQPSDEFIQQKVSYLEQSFLDLGIGFYDMSEIFSKEKPFEDITVNMYGKSIVIVDMDLVDSAIAYFRPVIRGFIVLLLCIYNYNQFMGFIGQGSMTLGSIIRSVRSEKE